MGEHSIVAARASVLVYDDGNSRWVASGSSQGLSKVHIYHHTANGTFRVVGRKLQDHEVVINCAILKGLKYNQATATFHQWRDNRQVYGLNFTSREDADSFAHAMLTALDTLNNGGQRQVPPAAPVIPQSHYQMPNMPQMAPQVISHQQNGPVTDDEKISQPVREPYQTHQRSSSKGNSQTVYMGSGTWTVDQPSHDQVTLSSQQAPQAPPQNIPKAPAQGVPPAPPPPPTSAAVPPAPPPPPPPSSGVDAGKPPVAPSTMINDGTLAAALKTATLRKTSKTSDDDACNTGTLGRSGVPSFPGSGDMMTEMAQKLRQRRQRAEEGDAPGNGTGGTATAAAAAAAVTTGDSPRKPWEKSSQNNQNNSSTSNNGNGTATAKTNGSESPRLSRSKRFQSLTGQENFSQFAANNSSGALSAELETFKLEIISEMKRELQRAKQEIIEAVRQEMSRQ